MEAQGSYKPGLEGVVAAETEVSYLDVEAEEIVIKGYDLIELAEKRQYLDLVGLLLEGELPSNQRKKEIEWILQKEYQLQDEILEILRLLPKETHPMDALRTGISILSGYDHTIDDRTESGNREKAMRLLGKIPTLVASSYHLLNEEDVIDPRTELSFSANFLYMMTGREASALEVDVFDQSLVAYSEHEMPNSTFAARVIASTHADIYGALTGAVSSLKGHLHGGANEAVMRMLLEADTIEGFKKLIYDKLQNKERIMGFGHRVYMKKMDPRATLMKKALRSLAKEKDNFTLYDMCEAGEQVMKEEKGLYPNLDYYAAPVYYMLGIPIDLFTPVFFAARTVGLAAHVMEQHSHNRLFRPRVNYTGPRHLHP
ncbi:citrate synthase [Pullulanibacillus pueri]|uniref:Citrate synthase n=1 Tax=Pullulanibacillus pueri TaxID=1437324 RepID=A0A8J2ZTR2_9BACL|nr:citrate synthase [Pullulanibacillus pueri]MBM7680332.1 citrate synthase [Pullulanibacillus pueri]GGH75606.1 citrate synthase [Pullulanibacillus pueri]